MKTHLIFENPTVIDNAIEVSKDLLTLNLNLEKAKYQHGVHSVAALKIKRAMVEVQRLMNVSLVIKANLLKELSNAVSFETMNNGKRVTYKFEGGSWWSYLHNFSSGALMRYEKCRAQDLIKLYYNRVKKVA